MRWPLSDFYTAFDTVTGENSKSLAMVPAGSYVVTASMYAVTNDAAHSGSVSCEVDSGNRVAGFEGLAVGTIGPAPTGTADYNVVSVNTAMTIAPVAEP